MKIRFTKNKINSLFPSYEVWVDDFTNPGVVRKGFDGWRIYTGMYLEPSIEIYKTRKLAAEALCR